MLNMQNVKDIEITEGNVRTIHDKDNRLIWGRLAYDTKYAGDTYQQTYSGANFYNVKDVASASSSGVSVDDEGWITLEKNNTGSSTQYVNYFSNILAVQSNTDYLIVVEIKDFTPGNNGTLSIAGTANTEQFKSDSSLNISFSTMQKGVSTYIRKSVADFTGVTYGLRTTLVVSANTNRSVTFRISVLADTSITPATFVYQPFTGNIPAPNPDYPQPIQVVTGEQNVWVHGKNMFDKDSPTVRMSFNTDKVFIANYGEYMKIVPCQPNTTYSIRCLRNNTYARNNVLLCEQYPEIGDSFIQRVALSEDGASHWKRSFTTTATTHYLAINIANSSSNPYTADEIFASAQLELGEESTAYEPYQGQSYPISLGSTELCKIGDYQDYIYKSGDDWYVHKACGKYVFDGTETWVSGAYGTNSWTLDNVIITSFDTTKTQAISNLFRGVPHDDRNIAGNNIIYFGSNIRLWIRNTSLATLTNVQSATNGNYVYYVLATPTDTQITDATLISQLDAVHEWLTRYGYSSTVTGNLPIIINKTNL